MFNIIWVELLRGWQTQLNYPFSFVLNMIQNIVFMGAAVWILSSLTSLEEVLGILFWPVALTALASSAQSVQEDMQLGTFERVASSRVSLLGILLSRTIASFLLATSLTLLAIGLVYFFLDISFSMLVVVTFLILIFFTGTGLSLILTGLQIYFRDTGPLGNMIVFGSMISLVIPWGGWFEFIQYYVYVFVPFSGLAAYIQTIDHSLLWVSIMNAGLYFVLGLLAFPFLFKRARLIKGLGRY